MRRFVSKHGATVVILALLALNVVLIVPLISGRNAIPEPADAAGSALPTEPTGSASVPNPSAEASLPGESSESSPSRDLVSGSPRRLLAANSDQVAWRAEPAGCGEDSKIEVTTDGGKTWRETDSGLKSVVRLRAFGDSSVFAIGADQDCKPIYAVDAYPGAGVADRQLDAVGDLVPVTGRSQYRARPAGHDVEAMWRSRTGRPGRTG
ncbi:hypothetical protein [Microlunatus sp. Gsoil 973]|uniref:hypothetical protein n=1 Tax=Microlunatus sp. Gsoil 973 TaxID=2672569 RepID=UPI0012B498D3|nr:hypothetical protein [Microlunatus sp. Gsoil 973]QGN32807.1 hypothetical protein GJV80_08280 [Microlunatus sp. Gsoil 973]